MALTLFVIISTMRRAARARQKKIEQYAAQEVARTLTKNQFWTETLRQRVVNKASY